MDYKDALKVLQELRQLPTRALEKLLDEHGFGAHRRGPLSYYLANLERYVEALFTGNSLSLKSGDRVRLKEDIVLEDPFHGWYGCKHMLKKDALATVDSVEFSSKSLTFTAALVFDLESWIDKEGVERPVSSKHTFCFRQHHLEKVSEGDEETLIFKETTLKQKLRLFSKIQNIMLEQGLIKHSFEINHRPLGKLFKSKSELTLLLKDISPYLRVPKHLGKEWKTVNLESLVQDLI